MPRPAGGRDRLVAAGSTSRPGRSLALVAAVTIALYAALAFGSTHSPKLGLDLRGGTEVILTAKPFAGGKVTKSALNKAVDIIRQRVNGLGVAEAEVTTQGNDHITVSVPGKGRDQVVSLVGTTALLRFRQVLAEGPGRTPSAPSPTSSASPAPSASAKAKASASATPKGRALSAALVAAASASPTPTPSPTGSATAGPSPSPTPTPALPAAGTLQEASAAYLAWDCTQNGNPTGGDDRPQDYMVSCSKDGTTKFLLGPAEVQGTQVSKADATLDQQGIEWIVTLSFNSKGAAAWGNLTARAAKQPEVNAGCNPPNGCNAVAIVLDGVVQSAPRIDSPNGIQGGSAQISGSFTQRSAKDLANVLKYGALPLRFEKSSVDSVSPTLGSDQLRGGLIAGAIGLGLVVLYSLLYYRGLGLVTVASLLVSGIVLYAATTVLGHTIGYTLTLAGIAGFIVAVGITADSFVVLFERIRDEAREGRRLRSAVDRAWPRARRTILSADTVSLLAAVVLYLLSVGGVRGFAFTLGLSTLSDLFIVFFFTRPLVTLLARSKSFDTGRPWTGLGRGRLGLTDPDTPPARARRGAAPKEA